MPPRAQRCGHCGTCKGKKCQQESCYLCLPCEKQVANNTHYAITGDETSASENKSDQKHRYHTHLSMSDNDDSATDPTSTAREVIGNIVSNFNRFSSDDITKSVSAGVSSTLVGGCSEVNSLDHTLTENLNETEILPSQNLKAVLPHNQTN